MEIKFEYKLDDKDFKAAGRLMIKKRSKRSLISLAMIVGLLVLFYFLPHDAVTPYAIGALFALLWLSLCGMLTAPSQVAKNYRSLPGMNEVNSLIVNQNGLAQSATSWRSTFEWNHFQTYTESKNHFFLLSGAYPLLWFPKRVLNELDQGNLRTLLKEKLQEE
jgi:hypothetical protein